MRSRTESSIVVLGAGGHGRIVADAALLAGFDVLGFADPKFTSGETIVAGLTVLGDDDWLLEQDASAVQIAIGIGALPGRRLRRDLHVAWSERGFVLPVIVHPGAVLARDVDPGAGSQIMAGSVVQTGARIGKDVIVNTRASIDHGCVLGDHVHIAPGAVLCGDVRVGDTSHVGPGAIVLPGVGIGRGAAIRPGAVVKGDVEDGGVVRRCGGH